MSNTTIAILVGTILSIVIIVVLIYLARVSRKHYCPSCGDEVDQPGDFCEECDYNLNPDDAEYNEETLIDYNRSLKLNPDDPETLYNRGFTLLELERYEEALTDFNHLLKIRPDDPDVLSNRGDTLYELGRYEEALRDYDLSLELCSDDLLTLESRGDTLSVLGRYEEALNDYNRALELEPDNQDILESRALALRELKQDQLGEDSDRPCDLNWIEDLSRLHQEALQMVLELKKLDKGITLTSSHRLKSSKSNMTSGCMEQLKELQDRFAYIEKSIRRLPKPTSSDLSKISRDMQSACRGYSGACKMFILWGKQPTNFIEISTMETLKKADKDMEKVNEQLALISNSQYTSELKPANKTLNRAKQSTEISLAERFTEGRDISHWLKALKSRKMENRFQALVALQYYEQDAEIVLNAFLEALHDKENLIRDFAAMVIEKSGDTGMNRVFHELNDESKDPTERISILHALFGNHVVSTKSHKDVVPPLIKFLKVNNPYVRARVIRILGALSPDSKDAVPYIKDALNDSDEIIRTAAAAALKEIEGG